MRVLFLTVIVSIFLFNAHPARANSGSGYDWGTIVAYFSDKHDAIVLPRPTVLAAGDIVKSKKFTLVRSLRSCLIDRDQRVSDLVEHIVLPAFEFSSLDWSIKVQVGIDGGKSIEAGVDVTRKDSFLENIQNPLSVFEMALRIGTDEIPDVVGGNCESLFDGTDPKIKDGSVFVIDRLYTFSGEMTGETKLDINVDGQAEISVKKFLKKIAEYPWIKEVIDKFDFGAKGAISAGVNTAQTSSYRFPKPRANGASSYLAFVPRSFNPPAFEAMQSRIKELSSTFERALTSPKQAIVFLKEFPQFSIDSKTSYFGNLFLFVDPYDKYVGNLPGSARQQVSETLSKVIEINRLAGKFFKPDSG